MTVADGAEKTCIDSGPGEMNCGIHDIATEFQAKLAATGWGQLQHAFANDGDLHRIAPSAVTAAVSVMVTVS